MLGKILTSPKTALALFSIVVIVGVHYIHKYHDISGSRKIQYNIIIHWPISITIRDMIYCVLLGKNIPETLANKQLRAVS